MTGLITSLEQLQHALRHGNLLHGSPRQLFQIEPRQANDTTGRPSGSQRAVYATSSLRTSIIHGVVHYPKQGFAHSFYECWESSGRLYGHNVQLDDGFVYILRRHNFEQNIDEDGEPLNEFVCRHSVHPIGIVKVTPKLLDPLNVTVKIYP